MGPSRLEDAARAILLNPSRVPKAPRLGNRQFILQVWHLPSSDSWMSWTVYSPWSGMTDKALVRRTIWNHQSDREKARTRPTLHSGDAPLDWKQVGKWRAELAELVIPLVQDRALALVGEANGLRCGDEFLAMEFQWIDRGPAAWKDLVRFHDRVREACELLFM